MSEERQPVKVVIRCKHEGYAFDLEATPYVDHIPGLIKKLADAGIEPGNSPYLWEGQGDARSRNAPQAAPRPQSAKPAPQRRMNTGKNTEEPNGWTQSGNPICPRHQSEMQPSKYGENSWYCSQKTDNPDWANDRGYCTYSWNEPA